MKSLEAITSHMQYLTYKTMRDSHVYPNNVYNIQMYNEYTRLIVEWAIKNDPDIKLSKASNPPVKKEKAPIERASKRMKKNT